MSQTYDELNRTWKTTCKILLGEELGELKEYESWLLQYISKPRVEKSAVTGNDTYLVVEDYADGSKFVEFDKVDFNKRFEPLNINEIKDIDSIAGAVQERAYYTGSLVLGNSRFIEGSSNITDSTYILKSYFLDACQNVAYSMYLRQNKSVFGIFGSALSDFMIRDLVIGPNCHRLFESFRIRDCSDIYYSANLEACGDCLFCFNLSGKRRFIGNLELKPDEYTQLKKKLVAEMADTARKKKDSLFDVLAKLPHDKVDVVGLEEQEKFDFVPINAAFSKTFEIILKKTPGEMVAYESYLQKHRVPKIFKTKDSASNGDIPFTEGYGGSIMPKHRLVSDKEAFALSEKSPSLGLADVKGLSLNNTAALSKIAYMPLGHVSGRASNVGNVLWNNFNAINCYSGMGYAECKESAYCFWPRQSSYLFGSAMVFDSSFCIHAYYSKNLTRSFEIDGCTSCSDVYFSHNCENVRNSMFCFNAKNKNNAIGNAELPMEQYRNVKDMLVEQIADELVKNKDLKLDIFNIGCYKK